MRTIAIMVGALLLVACAGSASQEPGFNLWLTDPNGQAIQLTSGSATDLRPAWSPDGSRIAFGRDGDIVVIGADGTGEVDLTDGDPVDRYPSWSPDGTKIVFTRDDQLVVTEVSSGEIRQLTDDEMLHEYPDWSPDGESIVFVGGTEEPGPGVVHQVYVVPVGGGEPRALTNMDQLLVAPKWSPDGTRIAFFSHGDPFELWVMEADGAGVAEIAQGGFMSWAPDLGSLVFDREVGDGDIDLFVLDLHTMAERSLVDRPGVQTVPDWSPDGSMIVFSSDTS